MNPPATTAEVATWAQHQFAADAFRQVMELFEREGIDALAVKGIVLAYSLYDRVEERPMVDVDLRLRPRDLRRAIRALRNHGWKVGSTSRQLGTAELFVARTLVEIETTIGAPGVCAISVDRMLARSVERTGPQGVRHREPELHDHALLLCVNAFKDKLVLTTPWAREDLLRIARTPGFSPRTLASRAVEARLCELTRIVSEWLSTEPRGTPWRQVIGALPPRRRSLYASLYRALVHRAPSGPTLALVARAASDSHWMQGKALALGVAGNALRWVDGQGHARE